MIHERSFQSEQAQIEIDGWRAIAIDLFSNQVWYLFSILNFEFKFLILNSEFEFQFSILFSRFQFQF